MKVFKDIFASIVTPERLFSAWDEFKRGKEKRQDVLQFAWRLEENIFALSRDLRAGRYRHGPYSAFTIHDPKRRSIHKATVRDRIVHHAVFKALNPVFEPTFIPNSFSCRIGKGTHKGVQTLHGLLRKVSRNNTQPCFALKCDIEKFFASVDHEILLGILKKKIDDVRTLRLLHEIITSFRSTTRSMRERERESKNARATGLPIGNLTSQLFANVYLHGLDQFVKRTLCIRHYVRYTDDFVIVGATQAFLEDCLVPIEDFLLRHLYLSMHPKKIILRKYHQGVDFLGYVLFPKYRIVRTKTRRRMFRKLKQRAAEYTAGSISREKFEASLGSYRGVLSHANSFKVGQELENSAWFWVTE